ncbi:MAG: RNA polymerase sigma factor [Thermodesulfobacteriota bacterium]
METLSNIHCLKDQGADTIAPRSENSHPHSEGRWIELAQEGDRESFERIVIAYQQKVFNLAFRLLGEREEAEDLTQEVFINVFRHIGEFRGESQFSTWIYQVTTNHCRNRLKYLRRRFHHVTESIDDPVSTEEGEMGREIPDEGEIPEDQLYRRQVQELVQIALGRLRQEYREAVVLRDIQNLSYQEISEILGVPEGTIKSRLHRARWELKEILGLLGIQRGE